MNRRVCRGGFTLLDAAALVAFLGIAGASISLAQEGNARDRAKRTKDMTQIRGIHQAFVVWAQNNKDNYPLPSEIDKDDKTVKEKGKAKDTTANIMSLIVYNGMVGTEMLVSPAEINPAVKSHEAYAFDRPKEAVDPKKAKWDPSMKVGLIGEWGHISYAHLQPAGKRLGKWTNSFNSSEVVLANRGPEISGVELAADQEVPEKHGAAVTPTFAKKDSVALRMLGNGRSWSGHAVSNDNHAQFWSDHLASGRPFSHEFLAFRDGEKKRRSDVLFADEREDPVSTNHYLGIFKKAGAAPSDFEAIWD